ncbi:hypothetical protein [Sorangium sp. So ce1097]|uniref:hypothetical protein n=1 Tax=Sorangium sp. So ce1097 TaxID=3133330 RepID=UPI003F63437C
MAVKHGQTELAEARLQRGPARPERSGPQPFGRPTARGGHHGPSSAARSAHRERRAEARRRDQHGRDAQTAALIALVCGPPPEGRARWTIALVADEAERRRIVRSVSRETIRRTLADQDIKPWREEMWCVPKIDEPFVERMKDVLEPYARPHDPSEPVVAFDERPVALHDNARPDRRDAPRKANAHRLRVCASGDGQHPP